MFAPGFGGAPPIFMLMFLVVGGIILFVIVKNIAQAVHNMGQPVVSRDAMVVAKRQHVSRRHHHHGHGHVHHHSSTTYYVTFEFPDGSREEFRVSAREYGLLAEGDVGVLNSQGTWFKGFDRGPRVT